MAGWYKDKLILVPPQLVGEGDRARKGVVVGDLAFNYANQTLLES